MLTKETIYQYRDKEVKNYRDGWNKTEREHWKAGFNSCMNILFPFVEILQEHVDTEKRIVNKIEQLKNKT